ncbi:MAG: hypothetical protein JW913_17545 [Chitinispirillaceae bacterium]|nr:hypothetical protein [Chitinispirillaceae bacterium]
MKAIFFMFMMKKKRRISSTVLYTWLCLLPLQLHSRTDTAGGEFFTDLEKILRSDYLLCTGDSTERSLDELIRWRQTIDSATSGDDYPVIVRKFTEETGISAANARPCEIVRWMQRFEQQIRETYRFLSDERDSAIQRHDDSLFLLHELESVIRSAWDLVAIPFGLSLRSVRILMRRSNLAPVTASGATLMCDSLPVGIFAFNAAFHFSKDDRYWCYELESSSCNLDSLDTWARPMMDYLAAEIEKRTSQPPDHIYRIGRFDIVPGRLSICKLWNFPSATAYVGLARANNRFYAKVIVQQ